MAKEKSNNNEFLKKVLKRAESEGVHEEVRDKPPEVGNYASLPAGIDGIARLTRIIIGEYKKGTKYAGESYALLEGSVVKPKVFNGVNVFGRFTRLGPIALCDTETTTGKKKTFAENYQLFLDHLKLLGADFEGTSAEDVETHIEELIEQKPYFGFITSSSEKVTLSEEKGKFVVRQGNTVKGMYKNEQQARSMYPYANQEPPVWQNWNGKVEFEEEETYDEVEEEADYPTETEVEESSDNNDASDEDDTNDNASQMEENDVEELAKKAQEDDDEEAQDKLLAIANNLGIEQEKAEEADSWYDVATMITEALSGNLADDDQSSEPEVGDEVSYEGKEYEVVTVNKEKKTVTLKDAKGKKLVKNKKAVNVPWDDLE